MVYHCGIWGDPCSGVVYVYGLGSFFVPAPTSPRPPWYDAKVTFCRTAGEGVRRLQGSRKNSKRKQHFILFFLLPYGVIADNQLFMSFIYNCLTIVYKVNCLFYRIIVLYITIVYTIVCLF